MLSGRPKARDTAYCELLGLRLYHRPKDAYPDTCGPVSEVVTAPQPAGSPLYIVFTKPEYEIEREPIRRGPAGPFSIFDSNGYIVPVFWSANMVIYESEVFEFSPGGQIAIAHATGVDHGDAFEAGNHWYVQTLQIVPTKVSQEPVLSVVLGPPTFGFDDGCAGNFWSWRYRDLDARWLAGDPDRTPRGRRGKHHTDSDLPLVERRAEVCRPKWYVGPSGSVAEQFIQFQPGDRKAFHAYAEAWRSMQEKRTGYRLS